MTLDKYLSKENIENIKDDIHKKLKKLYSEDLQKCDKCELSNIDVNKIKKLHGKLGKYPILIISQNPSYYWPKKNKTGEVFGNLERLEKFGFIEYLKLYDITPDDFYITNIIKCCTYQNEPPKKKHAKICGDTWLKKELKIIRPKIIIALGGYAQWYINKSGLNKIYKVIFLKHPGAIQTRQDAIEWFEKFVNAILKVKG